MYVHVADGHQDFIIINMNLSHTPLSWQANNIFIIIARKRINTQCVYFSLQLVYLMF